MPLTVVMYHYVRPLAGTRHAGIKALELQRFRAQLAMLCRAYTPVSVRDVVRAITNDAHLPVNAALLTFDDGYADHYEHVFPLLRERGVPAVFFPVARAVLERRVLDVHKVQFILACQPDTALLIGEIETAIECARSAGSLLAIGEYRRQHWHAGRLDPPGVAYVKRLLQHALPPALRARIAADLFRRWVTEDERAFAEDLYLSLEQVREMAGAGMAIGGHGHDHLWMDRISPREQACEVDGALALLARVGVDMTNFAYAYPYGACDDGAVQLLRTRGCGVAFTTRAGIAEPDRENALVLPRLDTNDLPLNG